MTHSNSPYLSVGIDVGSTFSIMTIIDPHEKVVGKPFKILHNKIWDRSLCEAIRQICRH